eukprot:jgi/Mesvir1/25417/Mv14217-RA.1
MPASTSRYLQACARFVAIRTGLCPLRTSDKSWEGARAFVGLLRSSRVSTHEHRRWYSEVSSFNRPMAPAWKKVDAKGLPPSARSSHSVTCAGSSVYVIGGENAPRETIKEGLIHCFSIQGGGWSQQPHCARAGEEDPEQAIPPPLLGHGAAAVQRDGSDSLVIFGGREGGPLGLGKESGSLFIFDTKAGAWSSPTVSGAPPPPRSYHAMASVGPRVYIFGGCGKEGRLNDLFCLDTSTTPMTWTQLPYSQPEGEVPVARGGSCIVAMEKQGGGQGDLVYVVYGFCGKQLGDVWVYDTSAGKWSQVACSGDVPPPRSVFGSARLSGRRIFVFAGEEEASALGHEGAGNFFNDGFVLDTNTNTWEKVFAGGENGPSVRGWHSIGACQVGGKDQVYLFGGLSPENERLGDLWVWEA